MSKGDLASLRAQLRATATASAMQIIGHQNERHAQWLADRYVQQVDRMLQPVDGVIEIDADSTPEQVVNRL